MTKVSLADSFRPHLRGCGHEERARKARRWLEENGIFERDVEYSSFDNSITIGSRTNIHSFSAREICKKVRRLFGPYEVVVISRGEKLR